MKKVIYLCDFIKAVCKTSNNKNVYYLQVTKNYDSGKKYTECVFISQKDFNNLITKFGEPKDEK